MGMQYVLVKTIGSLPGPIILGHLLDLNCRLWQDICGQKGRCFVYDVNLVSRNICIFGVVLQGEEHITDTLRLRIAPYALTIYALKNELSKNIS